MLQKVDSVARKKNIDLKGLYKKSRELFLCNQLTLSKNSVYCNCSFFSSRI